MPTFNLELVTPARVLFEGEVQSLRAPGVEGSLGLMAGHAPLLTELKIGLIKIDLPNGAQEFVSCSGGFMEVTRQKTIILADSAEMAADIDVERARKALQAAEVALGSSEETNVADLKLQIERAKNRINVAQMRV